MTTTPVLHQPNITPDEAWWVETERTAQRLAKVSWTPDTYRGKPNEIMAAALGLYAVGEPLTPMTLKYVYVVNGTVDFMVDLIIALVHKHGHEIWVEESTAEQATVAGQRQGGAHVHRVTFTAQQAVAAGLSTKDVWKKYLPDMLVARAAKRLAKRMCPEALLGMPPASRYVVTDNGRVQLADIVHEQDQDVDDDIADAELVEPDKAEPIAADGADRENAARVDQVVGDPAAVPGPVDWRDQARAAGITKGALLRAARGLAQDRDQPQPETVEEIDDELGADALAELLP